MAEYIKLTLPEKIYERLQRWAELNEQTVDEAAAQYLAENLPDIDQLTVPPAEKDVAVEREKAAYQKLHPELKQQYLNQYVAIYGEKLVDVDADYGALLERVNQKYGNAFVWLARVEEQAGRTIRFRSPRSINRTS